MTVSRAFVLIALVPTACSVASPGWSCQVCYLVHLLAKRMSRKSCEFYLWIDYACINQLVRNGRPEGIN